jgi:nucleoid-associated protein YgaU
MSSNFQQNPVQALLAQTSLQNTLFSSTSRYYGLATATFTPPGGQAIAYVLRRFVPAPEQFQVIQEHTIVQGDRLDNLANQYLGDPTLFWRLCDANRAVRPEELTETPGNTIDITLPEGISGTQL